MDYTNLIGYFLAIILIGLLIYIVRSQVKEHMLQSDPLLVLLKQVIQPMQGYFDQKYPEAGINLKELKLYKGESSYTLNKNQILLCIYDGKEYYPINALLYVLFHELGHRANMLDVGHTENFYRIFDEILAEAGKIGIYNPSIPMIQGYCGT